MFGGKAGLVELPFCFTNPGDTILVPDPGYPDYLSGVALTKAQIETMPLIADKIIFYRIIQKLMTLLAKKQS